MDTTQQSMHEHENIANVVDNDGNEDKVV
jgi:hypothetical protein